MRIAVLDKDRDEAALICEVLQQAAHACVIVEEPGELKPDDIDALVVDWQSIGAEGLRALPAQRPTLLLAHRSDEDGIAGALSSGANDYLIKPVRRGELRTRMQVLLKRAYPETQQSEQVGFGPFTFEPKSARITLNGAAIDVTKKEFELALLFFRSLGRPLSRAYILETIWSREIDVPSRTLDTHVSRVRTKLGLEPKNGFRLAPVYSYGYRLEQLA